MCPHSDWFSTYESVEDGVIMIGNNAQCKVAGKGTIKIKTHDGVTLSNVRHIPDLKRNLISLGNLEENGCKCLVEGGVPNVSKSAIILINVTYQILYMFCKVLLLHVSQQFLCHPYQTQMLPSYGS